MTGASGVLMSVLNQSFAAIAEEMHRNLLRSAYSTIVRESRDASTAVFGPNGELIAQGQHTIPMLLNAFPPLMTNFRDAGLLASLQPGDAIIANDAYAGGQHLDDVIIVIPVFAGGQLIGYSGAMAHQLDLGAGSPGINPKAKELLEEGIIIPPLKIELDRDLGPTGILAQILARNIRVPDQTLGDLRAQIAAVRTGERRLQELARRYGVTTVTETMKALLDYTDSMMRRAVRDLPDGVYVAEEPMDDDGYSDQPKRVAVSLTIRDDHVDVDLTGTDPQSSAPVNAPLGSTLSAIQIAIKTVLLPPEVPANEGCNRAISINVPEGTLLNPRFPAPVSARMGACFKLFDAILHALSPIIEDRLIASSYSSVAAVALSKRTRQAQLLYREALGGGYGAGKGYDGADGVAITLTNTANTPVEFTERAHPYFMIESYSIRPGSGGRGRHRGGCGIEKAYRILEDGVRFAAYSDHHRVGPRGLAGGGPGARAEFILERDGEQREMPSLVIEDLRAGDVVRVRTAGGGGFGLPRPDSSNLR
jgi:N-methylhydantoinase B